MFWLLLAFFALAQGTPLKLCVPEIISEPCAQMAQDLPEVFTCVVAADTLGCLKKVSSGDADLTNVDPNALYLAGKFYDLQPITTELVRGNPFTAQGIALVRKGSPIDGPEDLQNKSSCHTGYGRTVGWQIPLGRLLSSGIITSTDCEEDELSMFQKFFDGSCVSGDWSDDPVVEAKLKSKYPHLCSRCKDPVACAEDDAYADYEGVINCIADGAADVGFTKLPALKEYLQKNPDFEQVAELLCFEGGRKSVTDPEPCVWGLRPSNAFVTRKGDPDEAERLVGILLQTQSRYSVPRVRIPEWYYASFLSSTKATGLRPTEVEKQNHVDYLGEFIHSIRKTRPGCEGANEDITFCVTSDGEHSKCEEFSRAAEAKGFWPDIGCVKATTKAACMQLIKDDNAQIAVLDGGDVYKAGKYFDLRPIASELYNGSDATYYAVVVLRSASDVTKLADLKDLRSCHTGIGRTAGWVMPIGALVSEGLLPPPSGENCNYAGSVADFFSAGSCVPGANDTKYNTDRVGSEQLCKHCVGDEEGQHKCSRDSKERYSGYSGALRCLAEGKGDVAFVKHLTVPDYTDGRSQLPWTKDLLSSDFKLLCDNGDTAPVNNYQQCNLGKVPSHQVVISKNLSESRRLNIARVLADSSEYFGLDPHCTPIPLYHLFKPGDQKADLLFKDSTTALKMTPLEATYEEILGRRFMEASRVADSKEC